MRSVLDQYIDRGHALISPVQKRYEVRQIAITKRLNVIARSTGYDKY